MIPGCLNRGGPGSRLLLAESGIPEQSLLLGGDAAGVLEAWRARPGEVFSVLDPDGTWWRARLDLSSGAPPRAVPFARLSTPPESPLEIDLFQAIPNRERFELVLEKAVEIGVSRILPFESRHSLTLAEREARQKKSHRWPELVRRAARQCRRGMLPELYPVLPWSEALDFSSQADVSILLYEGQAPRNFAHTLKEREAGRVALLIGPEGGFAPEEVALAQACGVLPVSLGPRILRTESAAVIAAALVQFIAGDLN